MEDSDESNFKASGFVNLKNSKVMKCPESNKSLKDRIDKDEK